MQTAILIVLIIGFAVLFWLLFRRTQKGDSLLMLQEQLEQTRETLDSKLGKHRETLKDVDEKLVKIDKTADNVVDLATEVKTLQDILKNPQQRGALGEYYLENALENVLPPGSYEMQHTFEDGDRADAVIFAKDKIIPIDAKFSLDNYNKLHDTTDEDKREKLEKKLRSDLKERIKETSKYIKPDENTTEFAFMFIPSEALYYDLLVNKVGSVQTRDLIEYATGEKNVIVVSPTSFYAYLQTVLQGLKGLKIEESAQNIRKQVRHLQRHLESYEKNLKKMGKHLSTVVRSFNDAYHEFSKIDKDIYRITEESMDVEASELDLPKNENE